MTESSDERFVVDGIVGLQVRSVDLDGGVRLRLGTAGEPPRCKFDIEGPAEIAEHGGVRRAFASLDLAADVETCERLGRLLGSSVTVVDVRTSGTISVEFSTGPAVFVSPGDWESWHLSTPAVVVHALPSGRGITWVDA